MSELTPPPAQPLHIAWRGIRPGDAVLLAAAILGGGLYVLLDLSWGRGLIASAAIGLVVVLVLPYRGLRLGTVLWLRFRHAWDALLTWLFPTRHQQLSTLLAQPTKPSLALLDAAPDPTDTAAWHPAWAAAWEQTALPVPRCPDASSACEGEKTPVGDALVGALALPADRRSWWPGIVGLEQVREAGPWWPGLGHEGCWPKGPQTLGEIRAWREDV